MEKDKACSIFGHRKITATIDFRERLYKCFEDMICNDGVGYFYFGGFGEFDDLCHEIITELKRKYIFLKRIYVCEDFKFVDRPQKRLRWLTNEDYEEFVYFDMLYTGFFSRIYFRNCEIIDHSDYIVFYAEERENSGAYKTLKYAKKKKKNIINFYL